MSKKILGLDLGTNSIGWALVEHNIENKEGKILGMGSRIIPMDAAILGEFDKGNSISQTANRTKYRSTRRLYERHHLRRERLHRVLNTLGFLPEHYKNEIHFTDEVVNGKTIKKYGKFREDKEPKLVWKPNGKKESGKDKFEFLFQKSFKEMIEEFKKNQPQLFYEKENGEETKIPYDWTIYYLRKKALTEKLTKEQLAWLILNFNQKRGYYQLRGEEEEVNESKSVEFHSLKIIEVRAEIKYLLTLENNEVYYKSSEEPLFDWKDTNRDFIVTTYQGNDGKEKRSHILKDDLALLKSKKAKLNRKKNNEKVEEKSIKIIEVKEEKQDKIWYSLVLENGWVYRRESKTSLLDWKDKVREFIVTTDLNDDGTVKTDEEGKESRSYRSPKEDDWTLIKKKTENNLDEYIQEYKKNNNEVKGTVGTYIYDSLLQNPKQKINGKLIRTIERKFYKDELRTILKKQIELQPELFKDDLYNDCVRELYKSNEAHQLSLSKRDFEHLFLDDIIFYQRPLKSQKSSIGNCSLEFRLHKIHKKDEKGNPINKSFEQDSNGKDIKIKEYLKCIPKSNPFYQEFRVWQWLSNLKIHTKADDKDVTTQFINSNEDKEKLFEFLMSQKEVDHKDILAYLLTPFLKEKYPNAKPKAFNSELKKEIAKYRWNYVYDSEKDESKLYPMNKTGYEIRNRLKKVIKNPDEFLKKTDTIEHLNKKEEKVTISKGTREYQLWHIIYSVTDKKEYETALETFAKNYFLFYEQEKDEKGYRKENDRCFIKNFKSLIWTEKDYGSYSEKAIKKLLPLMRLGNHWSFDAIDVKTQTRIANLQTAEVDESIRDRVREQVQKGELKKDGDYQGLPLWLAQYIVYDRHSEASDIGKWHSIEDLKIFLKEFKQHSLRNPIVEQVITETLRVVQDIWKHYGKGAENYFDEIHIELGREMKNTAEDRKQITNQVSENENTNLRIKALLMEFANDDSFKNTEDFKDEKGNTPDFYKKGNNPVRPYSPTQHDILKIYEEYAINNYSEQDLKNEKTGLTETKDGKTKEVTIYDISQKSQPTKAQVEKYKLWLEQKYRSPYTGKPIPLSKLFTPAYQIEHIIPQSRYFDDSFSNKVICEAEVNALKDRLLGLEFIQKHHGEKVQTIFGEVEIFQVDTYKSFVNEHYDKNRGKKTKLLLEDIPDKMIARQMNDTRYITKYIMQLLSNIVRIDEAQAKKIIDDAEVLAKKETDTNKAEEIREKAKKEANDDGVNSKNIIPGNGKITSILKQDWGLNDVWNELVLPRFERVHNLNENIRNELIKEYNKKNNAFESEKNKILENTKKSENEEDKEIKKIEKQIWELNRNIQLLIFTGKNKEGHTIPAIPLELSKGFQKKRIDHRHHAIDALVIACATRDHVNLLNNQSAKSENSRYDLQNKLRNKEKWQDKNGVVREKFTEFKKPWDNFTIDAKNKLEGIMVSFKQNLRVINKATNHYEKIENGKKVKVEQKGVNWAIRKSLHTPMPYGKKMYDFEMLKIAENVGKRELIIDNKIRTKVEVVFQQHKSKVTDTQKFLKKNPIKDDNGNEITSIAFKLKFEKFRKRQPIMELANRGQGGIKTVEDAMKFIDKVADFKIREDLLNHLKVCGSELEKAFSAEGIENFNSKRKIPVYKLPIAESGSGRFAVGNRIGTKHKWVEADKGTNLFYAIYTNEQQFCKGAVKKLTNRSFETIPLNIIIERQKQGLKAVPEKNDMNEKLLFYLSPDDLVYIPTEAEQENINTIDFNNLTKEQMERVYFVNDFSGSTCYFRPNRIAKAIVEKEVDMSYSEKKNKITGSFDTKTASLDGKQIKDICIKLKIDRLGNISKA